MTDRPILMSAPMVRALLDGRKTQTRRVVKPMVGLQRTWLTPEGLNVVPSGFVSRSEVGFGWQMEHPQGGPGGWVRCPYGAPGDRLWVREAWTQVPASAYRRSEGVQQTVSPSDPDMAAIYAAGWERSIPKWRPSIHMPRWASRLTLTITDVRVERLQAISAADADAEGFGGDYPDRVMPDVFPARDGGWGHLSMPECYARLWNHINGPDAWDANPWVWALTFTVQKANIDAKPKEIVG